MTGVNRRAVGLPGSVARSSEASFPEVAPTELERLIENAYNQLSRGAMVVLIDSVRHVGVAGFSGHALTPSRVNFLISECRGILYAGVAAERLDYLGVPSQTTERGVTDKVRVSVDWAASGMTTGISAVERANTIRALFGNDEPASFRCPGHVVPVALYREPEFQHFYLTEALSYLCGEAGLHSGVVLCAVLAEDGTQANPDELREFARCHHSVAIDVAEVLRIRRARHGWKTPWPGTASFELRHFARSLLVHGAQLHLPREQLAVSVHALCVYGQILGGACECRFRLDDALRRLKQVDSGAVVIVDQYAGRKSFLDSGAACRADSVSLGGVADLVAAELSAAHAMPL
jgi:3,4-dihydroxy 2-butanone 4-phosphate synthase / GTP cyclohydrolase II